MLIDCDQCVMQHTTACDDCIVTVLIGSNEGVVHLADTETVALRNLADAGMVAPLRLVRRSDDRDTAPTNGSSCGEAGRLGEARPG